MLQSVVVLVQLSQITFQKQHVLILLSKVLIYIDFHRARSRDIDQGPVVRSRIKLTKGSREFLLQFCNFLVGCSVYIVYLSVLSCSDFKLHLTLEVKNIFKQEKKMLQLTFNPGLTLTGFRTTRPWFHLFA